MSDLTERLRRRGYADGSYHCICLNCAGQFVGDKQATNCKGCATAAEKIEHLRTENERLREEVEEWREYDARPTDIDYTQAELDAAVKAEGEACAKVAVAYGDRLVGQHGSYPESNGYLEGQEIAASRIAAAIRARGE